MASSSNEFPQPINTNNAPVITQVIESISDLSNVLHNAKASIPLRRPNTTTNNNSIINSTKESIANTSNVGSDSEHENYQQLHNQLEKLKIDLKYIKGAMGQLQGLVDVFSNQLKTLRDKCQSLESMCSNGRPADGFEDNFRSITQMVTNLKLQTPSLHKMKLDHRQTVRVVTARNLIDAMLNLPKSKKFRGCLGVESFEEAFESRSAIEINMYGDYDSWSAIKIENFVEHLERRWQNPYEDFLEEDLKSRCLEFESSYEASYESRCLAVENFMKKFERRCLAVENFEKNYDSLDLRSQDCLLCFSVFPEDAVVEKTFLTYWWIGEGFIDSQYDGDKRAEEVADEILKNFLEKGFIEPVLKKRKLIGFKVHELIRYVIMFLADGKGFFNFDFTWNPTVDFSRCKRACLVETEEVNSQQPLENASRLDMKNIQTFINVNVNVYSLDLDLSGGWLPRMSNLNVLCLGICFNVLCFGICYKRDGYVLVPFRDSWIVGGNKFLKGSQTMKQLKFLSFRRMWYVYELPYIICKFDDIRILDLNQCGLAKLPKEMGSLKKLTHLDISSSLFGHPFDIPQTIGLLVQLQVLKGFVISKRKAKGSATLDDLKGLQRLRKLSIKTEKRDFPTNQDLIALRCIKSLRKLTIQWVGSSDDPCSENGTDTTLGLPEDLEKLDLHNYPETEAPTWLMPCKLKCLKYLYIRRTHLQNLDHALRGSDKWNVKILRLMELDELAVDWTEIQVAFPNLIYLEKHECPKLAFFPCEEYGVWLNKEILSEHSALQELEFKWSFLANTSS